MADRANWLFTVWAMVDERLAGLSDSLQGLVRMLRIAVAGLVVGILLVLASPVVLIFWPAWFPVAYAVSTIVLIVPLVAVTVLAAIPLRMKSVVRLIDKGYPANAKELAIRIAARKLRDQSIETEELLVETALNEGRKVLERYKARASVLEQDAAQGTGSAPRDPSSPAAAPGAP